MNDCKNIYLNSYNFTVTSKKYRPQWLADGEVFDYRWAKTVSDIV